MKLVVCFVSVALAALAMARPEGDVYTTKFDDVNVEDIIKSDRLLQGYVKCALDKGPCTPDGAELKRNLPDALLTGCSKCSEKQKAGAEKVIRHLIKEKPELFKTLEEKYDPDETYRKKYEAELKKVSQ